MLGSEWITFFAHQPRDAVVVFCVRREMQDLEFGDDGCAYIPVMPTGRLGNHIVLEPEPMDWDDD